jgi:hypothetical protein
MDRRQQFLNEFLGALGALEIQQLHVTPMAISGTVVYDPSVPDERQDFRWSVPSDAAPSPAAICLAGIIRRGDLLRIDKLRVSRQELLTQFNATQSSPYSPERFSTVLDELLQIQIPMLDDGVESDYFFMHE